MKKNYKINVAHVFGNFGAGGMEVSIVNYLKLTDYSRINHYLFVNKNTGILKKEINKLPVKVFTVKHQLQHDRFFIPYGKLLINMLGINLINGHEFFGYYYAYRLIKNSKIPFIASDHSLGYARSTDDRKLEKVIYKQASFITCASDAVRDNDSNLFNEEETDKSKFVTIRPLCRLINNKNFSENELSNFKKEYGINNNFPIIVIVGRLIKVKGHRLAINAVTKLHENDYPVNLLIVGRKTGEEILTENDLSKNYIYHVNETFDLRKIWSIGDLFLIPSLSEGTPLVLLEYLQMGKLILASDISGNKEIIRDGENGFLFESGNLDSLINNIKKVLETENKDIIKKNAAKCFHNSLSPQKIAKQIDDIYLRICTRI